MEGFIKELDFNGNNCSIYACFCRSWFGILLEIRVFWKCNFIYNFHSGIIYKAESRACFKGKG